MAVDAHWREKLEVRLLDPDWKPSERILEDVTAHLSGNSAYGIIHRTSVSGGEDKFCKLEPSEIEEFITGQLTQNRIVSITGGKGGSGKTTLSTLIVIEFARKLAIGHYQELSQDYQRLSEEFSTLNYTDLAQSSRDIAGLANELTDLLTRRKHDLLDEKIVELTLKASELVDTTRARDRENKDLTRRVYDLSQKRARRVLYVDMDPGRQAHDYVLGRIEGYDSTRKGRMAKLTSRDLDTQGAAISAIRSLGLEIARLETLDNETIVYVRDERKDEVVQSAYRIIKTSDNKYKVTRELDGTDEIVNGKPLEQVIKRIRGVPNLDFLPGKRLLISQDGRKIENPYTLTEMEKLRSAIRTFNGIIVLDMGAGSAEDENLIDGTAAWYRVSTSCTTIFSLQQNERNSQNKAYEVAAATIEKIIDDMYKAEPEKQKLFREAIAYARKQTGNPDYRERKEQNPQTMKIALNYIINSGGKIIDDENERRQFAQQIYNFLKNRLNFTVVINLASEDKYQEVAQDFIKVLGEDYMLKRKKAGEIKPGEDPYEYTVRCLGLIKQSDTISNARFADGFYLLDVDPESPNVFDDAFEVADRLGDTALAHVNSRLGHSRDLSQHNLYKIFRGSENWRIRMLEYLTLRKVQERANQTYGGIQDGTVPVTA